LTSNGAAYLVLIVYSVISIVPFIWLLSSSLKPLSANVYSWPPEFIPRPPTLMHYQDLFSIYPFLRFTLNSFGVAAAHVLTNVVLGSMAGYALARLHFPGRELIFYAILATMTMPATVVIVPLFVTAADLGITDSYLGLILPTAVGGFSIFLFRQAFRQVPGEIEDAARVDGASSLQIYARIMFPLVRPTIATVAVFTFYGSWNEFLWPLVILQNDARYTLPLGLAQLQGQLYGNWFQLAAGSVVMMVPVLIIFFGAQRHFVAGLTAGATKG
jgi:ABC-type glycerol-3-phosphate transport system permease component